MMQVGDIILQKSLGKGGFGEVFLSTLKGKKGVFATKKIDKKDTDSNEEKRKLLKNEIKLLKLLNHPNIIKLEDVKSTKDNYYLVMEYANGGSIEEYLEKYEEKNKKYFSEEIIQYFMKQIMNALKYIHSQKVIHRDLKLENIMLNYDNDIDRKSGNLFKSIIKIIDFGASVQGQNATTIIGTPVYMDPYVLKKMTNCTAERIRLQKEDAYNEKVDIWSIGTACYEMLMGRIIVYNNRPDDILRKIDQGLFSIPKTISNELSSFLSCMLQPDPQKRSSAAELMKHPFLTKKVKDFVNIDTKTIINSLHNRSLNINIKNSQSIWPLINDVLNVNLVKEQREDPIKEDDSLIYYKKANTEIIRNVPQNYIQKNMHKQTSFENNYNHNQYGLNSGNAQNVYLNDPNNPYNKFQMMNNMGMNNNYNNKSYGIQMQNPYQMNNNSQNNNNNQINVNKSDNLINTNKSNHYRPMDNDDSEQKDKCLII